MRNGTYALTVSKAGFATGKLGIAVPISKELRIVLQVDHTPIVDGLVVGGVPTTTSELPSTISTEAMCGMQTYYDSLTLAFQNAVNAGGETLLMLQVLPSFQCEYAVTVKRASSGINLYRTAFQKQLWHELGPPLHVSRTRQQCLDIAKNAQIDTVLIPAPTEQANRLWEVFSKITFESHLREKNLLAQDGTQYIIARPDGASVRLQEAAGGRGLKSENTQLLNWVHSMLRVVQLAENASLSPYLAYPISLLTIYQNVKSPWAFGDVNTARSRARLRVVHCDSIFHFALSTSGTKAHPPAKGAGRVGQPHFGTHRTRA